MFFEILFTDGSTTRLRAGNDLFKEVLDVYGYPHKVGIESIELNHGDGTYNTFVPK